MLVLINPSPSNVKALKLLNFSISSNDCKPLKIAKMTILFSLKTLEFFKKSKKNLRNFYPILIVYFLGKTRAGYWSRPRWSWRKMDRMDRFACCRWQPTSTCCQMALRTGRGQEQDHLGLLWIHRSSFSSIQNQLWNCQITLRCWSRHWSIYCFRWIYSPPYSSCHG